MVRKEHNGDFWIVHLLNVESGEQSVVSESEHDDQYPVISVDHVVFVHSSIDGDATQLIAHSLEVDEEEILVSCHFVQRPSMPGIAGRLRRLAVWAAGYLRPESGCR